MRRWRKKTRWRKERSNQSLSASKSLCIKLDNNYYYHWGTIRRVEVQLNISTALCLTAVWLNFVFCQLLILVSTFKVTILYYHIFDFNASRKQLKIVNETILKKVVHWASLWVDHDIGFDLDSIELFTTKCNDKSLHLKNDSEQILAYCKKH